MATTKKPNVVNLAKNKTTSKKPTISKAKTENKTATEKAKEKVQELLSDVNLEKRDKESFELIEETPEKIKGAEWLEEQVQKLTEVNEKLNKENQELRIKDSSSTEASVIRLFNEFQTEYLKHSPQTMAYTTIYLSALMNKMLGTFPFLQGHKRY